MPDWNHYVQRILELMKRYPGLIAAFGFCSGVSSFILVDRQQGMARWIAVILLVSWVWLMLENSFTQLFSRVFKREIPPPLLRYATQMIHQESLFFVLPFFFVTTAWNSGQSVFTGLLGAAALVSIIDPLYYKWLAARRWLYLSFHTLALFAVLLVALPLIVHLTTAESYRLALGVALVVALPSLGSSLRIQRWWRWPVLAGLLLALGLGAWLARPWVPPATLWLTQVAVTAELQQRNPGRSLERVEVAQLRQAGLYAYTAISAPRGLNERIYHVWKRDGVEMDRIALDIHGGRKAGYRAWTHKRNFPAQAAGDWQVQVVTEAGQQIGVLRFVVTDQAGPVRP